MNKGGGIWGTAKDPAPDWLSGLLDKEKLATIQVYQLNQTIKLVQGQLTGLKLARDLLVKEFPNIKGTLEKLSAGDPDADPD